MGAGAALHQWPILHLRRDGTERRQCVPPDVCPPGNEYNGPVAAVQREFVWSFFVWKLLAVGLTRGDGPPAGRADNVV